MCGWPRPAGAVVHAARLARALAGAGVDARAMAVAVPGAPHLDGAVLPVEVADGDAHPDPEAVAVALSASVHAPLDVGHAEDASAAGALLRMRAEGRIRAVVTTVHQLWARGGAREELERRAVQESDVVVVASRWWAERITREFGVAAEVVPHGVEVARFSGHSSSRAEAGAAFGWGTRPAVLTLGGVQQRKGSRVLLEAFGRSRGRMGESPLLVVGGPGDGGEYHRAWMEDAGRLGLRVHAGPAPPPEADVVELGAVPSDEMPLLYRACDVLASPSTREGFGLPALEAAAAGVPTVLSDLPVYREHFTDGVSCLMVPLGVVAPLSAALVRAVREPALRDRLVEGARLVARGLSWETSARGHERVYRLALTRAAAGGRGGAGPVRD
jgi:glycosyltransferase involved in cell wall biosynthesis